MGGKPLDLQDVIHRIASEVKRQLRYSPGWTGNAAAAIPVKRGNPDGIEIQLTTVETEDVDIRAFRSEERTERNAETLKDFAARFTERWEEAVKRSKAAADPSEKWHGKATARLYVKHGVITRYEVHTQDTHLSPYRR